MYGADCNDVLRILNADDDVAFLMLTRPNFWEATERLDRLCVRTYSLWHVPSGPIPAATADGNALIVDDPWKGWSGTSIAGDPDNPILVGGSQPGILRFQVSNSGDGPADVLHVSYLKWVGNRVNAKLGRPTSQATEHWFNRFRRKISSMSTSVPAGGLASRNAKQIAVLQCAFRALQAGIPTDEDTIQSSGRTSMDRPPWLR